MTVPRPAKKIAPPLPNWRTTLWHAHAIYHMAVAKAAVTASLFSMDGQESA